MFCEEDCFVVGLGVGGGGESAEDVGECGVFCWWGGRGFAVAVFFPLNVFLLVFLFALSLLLSAVAFLLTAFWAFAGFIVVGVGCCGFRGLGGFWRWGGFRGGVFCCGGGGGGEADFFPAGFDFGFGAGGEGGSYV